MNTRQGEKIASKFRSNPKKKQTTTSYKSSSSSDDLADIAKILLEQKTNARVEELKPPKVSLDFAIKESLKRIAELFLSNSDFHAADLWMRQSDCDYEQMFSIVNKNTIEAWELLNETFVGRKSSFNNAHLVGPVIPKALQQNTPILEFSSELDKAQRFQTLIGLPVEMPAKGVLCFYSMVRPQSDPFELLACIQRHEDSLGGQLKRKQPNDRHQAEYPPTANQYDEHSLCSAQDDFRPQGYPDPSDWGGFAQEPRAKLLRTQQAVKSDDTETTLRSSRSFSNESATIDDYGCYVPPQLKWALPHQRQHPHAPYQQHFEEREQVSIQMKNDGYRSWQQFPNSSSTSRRFGGPPRSIWEQSIQQLTNSFPTQLASPSPQQYPYSKRTPTDTQYRELKPHPAGCISAQTAALDSAPPPAMKKLSETIRRKNGAVLHLCRVEGCEKLAQGSTNFCISHGGGNRCVFPGCKHGARDKFLCATHGGGKRCAHENCTKAAVGKYSFCTAHGGGRRCEEPGCTKAAQSNTKNCVRHGGGKRCSVEGCKKVSRGKTQFCTHHFAEDQVNVDTDSDRKTPKCLIDSSTTVSEPTKEPTPASLKFQNYKFPARKSTEFVSNE